MKKDVFIFILTTTLLLTTFTPTLAAKPKQLTDFNSILDALKQGYTVKAVTHYKDCQLITNNKIQEKSPNAIGGMELSTFEYFAPGSVRNKTGFLAASKTVLINHPHYGIVLNYAKMRIYENNKIQIISQYINPKSYETQMTQSFYTKINKNKKGAAYFYQK